MSGQKIGRRDLKCLKITGRCNYSKSSENTENQIENIMNRAIINKNDNRF